MMLRGALILCSWRTEPDLGGQTAIRRRRREGVSAPDDDQDCLVRFSPDRLLSRHLASGNAVEVNPSGAGNEPSAIAGVRRVVTQGGFEQSPRNLYPLQDVAIDADLQRWPWRRRLPRPEGQREPL